MKIVNSYFGERKIFEVGDKVKIKNIGKNIGNNVDGKIGTIESIDGAYHYVLIDGRSEENVIELYRGEMELVD